MSIENKHLMTLKDIAELHSCSQRHARDIITKLPDFPKESPTSTPRHRVWPTARVLAYIRGEEYA